MKTNTVVIRLLLSFSLIILGSPILFAQDVLKLKSGREIKADIIEEDQSIVKYREYGTSSGPLYSVARDKIESITYDKKTVANENKEGKTEINKEPVINSAESDMLSVKKRYVQQNGKNLSTRHVKTIMEDHPEALDLYSSGQRLCNASNGCAGGVILTSFIAGQVSNKMNESDKKTVLATGLGIDAGFIIAAIIMSTKGKKKIRKSVEIYNSRVNNQANLDLDLKMTPQSMGVVLKF